MDAPQRPAPRAWTPARIVLTILGSLCLVAGVAIFVYGLVLFFTVILLPVGIAFMAIGVGLAIAGLLLVASPWVHYWWARRKARATSRVVP